MRQECGGCIDELLAAELLAAELTHVEEHIPQSDTTHTHGSEVFKSPSPFTSFP